MKNLKDELFEDFQDQELTRKNMSKVIGGLNTETSGAGEYTTGDHWTHIGSSTWLGWDNDNETCADR